MVSSAYSTKRRGSPNYHGDFVGSNWLPLNLVMANQEEQGSVFGDFMESNGLLSVSWVFDGANQEEQWLGMPDCCKDIQCLRKKARDTYKRCAEEQGKARIVVLGTSKCLSSRARYRKTQVYLLHENLKGFLVRRRG